MDSQKLRLPSATDPSARLDKALLETLQERHPTVSRQKLKFWFKSEWILLNGRPVAGSQMLSQIARTGMEEDELEILHWSKLIATDPEASPAAQGSFIPVVYEDEEILILNKPSGIPTLPHSAEETDTAVGSALAHFPGLRGIGTKPLEPGLLHRLDTGTSGLLVFAKSGAEFDRLRALWKERRVRKIYRAIVLASEINPPTPRRIDTPLFHDPKSKKRMVTRSHTDWRNPTSAAPHAHTSTKAPLGAAERSSEKPLPAITDVRIIRKIRNSTRLATEAGSAPPPQSQAAGPHPWDLEIEIQTGVMHQIRCHVSSQGWPIVGDTLYRGEKSSRLWLHAWRLTFTLSSGCELTVESALPESWPH